MGEVEHTYYCACGARLKVTVPASDALYPVVEVLLGAFTKEHRGEGHHAVTAKQCAAVRRRLERQRRAEIRARVG